MPNTNSNKTSNKTLIKTLTYNLLNCLFGLKINKRKGQIAGTEIDSYKQSTLAPTKIEKDELSYETVKYLAAQLKNPDIKNIAVTGPYGSGKSSVLRTLEEDYLNRECLNISLATLKYYEDKEDDNDDKKGNKEKNRKVSTETEHEDNGSSNPDSLESNEEELYDSESNEEDFNDDQTQRSKHNKQSSTEKLNRLIEYSILQQLIYKEKTDKTPNSRIKRIVHVEESKLRCTVFLFLVSLIVLFEPQFIRIEWMYDLLSNEWLNNIGDALAILFLLYLTFSVLVSLSRKIPNSTINKLNLKTVEIELSKNASIFNKHLDEILYFFQATKYNVIVFEDLDRFNTPEIFLKLRELNTLLNISKQIDRKIVFIYAVRDDLFVNTDRCKCFDYIVPIIPFINSYNSRDMLKKELERTGYADIDDEDLKNFAFYISDMRLIKNIANEYQQYRNILEANLSKQDENKEDKGVKQEREQNPESLIKPEKLLAMIVFKNHYPKEFSDLHYYKGKVFECFKLRNFFVEQVYNNRKEVWKEKSSEETNLRDEYIRLYQKKIKQKIEVPRHRNGLTPCIASFKIKDTYQSLQKFRQKEALFKFLIENKNLDFKYSLVPQYDLYDSVDPSLFSKGPYTDSIEINFEDIQREVNSEKTYTERLNEIKTKYAYSLIPQLHDVKVLPFDALMRRMNLEQCSGYKALKIEPLIEDLLRHGYIDENYYDYISLFHGKMISPHDWAFILKLKREKDFSYDYSFDNISSCIDEINVEVYGARSILNFEILDYWVHINEEKKHIPYYAEIEDRIKSIRDIALRDKKTWDFFALYYKKGRYSDIFFTDFCAEMFEEKWYDIEHYNEKYRDTLIEIFLKYTELGLLPTICSIWLSNNYSFLAERLDVISLHRIKDILNSLGGLYFKELQKEPPILLDYIIETHKFEMNIHNINLIADYLGIETSTELNLTSIKKAGNDYFINKIENNLDTFLNLISQTPASKKESKEVILEILQNDKLNEETKSNYLLKQENSIELNAINKPEYQTLPSNS